MTSPGKRCTHPDARPGMLINHNYQPVGERDGWSISQCVDCQQTIESQVLHFKGSEES